MWKKNSWQLLGTGAIYFGVVGLSGCPASVVAQAPDAEMIPVVQSNSTDTAIADFPPQAVVFEVCGDLPDWERLSLTDQTAELLNNPRYGAAIHEEPLKTLFDKFWNESVITFTTYGLSARTEPVYLSGVWTGIEQMDACYGGDRPEAINTGELAEVWLIGHRVVDIEWTGNEYELTVDSVPSGLQFVQFARLESELTLPIVVIEADGDHLTAASGDW